VRYVDTALHPRGVLLRKHGLSGAFMNSAVRLLAGFICIGLFAVASTALAQERKVLMTTTEVKGIKSQCVIPDTFTLSYSKKQNRIRFLRKAKMAHRGKTTFTVRRVDGNVGRVITTSITRKAVKVRELAVSLSHAGSCTFSFKSA
jgi:hypothetical protein